MTGIWVSQSWRSISWVGLAGCVCQPTNRVVLFFFGGKFKNKVLADLQMRNEKCKKLPAREC